MHIRYEPALPDVSYMVRAPLILDVEGQRIGSIDRWSLEGIALTPELDNVAGFGLLTIPFHGFGITLQVQLVRDQQAGILRFINLGNREFGVLWHFYREIVTGRAISIDRMISAMDVPLDLVPMQETASERKAGQASVLPRFLRTAFFVCLFSGMAFLAYRPIVMPAVAEYCADVGPRLMASR